MYASWADTLLVPGSLRFAGEAWGAKTSALALFRPYHLLFVLSAVAAMVVAWHSRPRLNAGMARRHPLLIAVGAASLIACVFLIESAGGAAAAGDGMNTARLHGLFAYELSALAGPGGADADAVARSVDVAEPASVAARIEQIQRRPTARRLATFVPGAYKGSNVLLVQVESMQGFLLGLEVEGHQITPNLNSLLESSWYFPNAFSQIGVGTTSDAEFVTNTSLLSAPEGPACVEYVGSDFPSLPKLLKDSSYFSYTMHANTAHFWNRTQLYPAIGFSQYFDRSYFGTGDQVGMGASDGLMLKKALPLIVNNARNGKYYAQIVTLSPHHPFTLPSRKQKLALPVWLADSVVGDYLQTMNYEDRCLGWLVRKLKASGQWDNTIVVIYGDHYGLRPADLAEGQNKQRCDVLLGHPYTFADRASVPLIIHLPGQTKGVVADQPVGQADIMPTLADALGVDLSGIPHFGNSAFTEGPYVVPLNVPMPEGTFVKGDTFYIGPESGGTPEGSLAQNVAGDTSAVGLRIRCSSRPRTHATLGGVCSRTSAERDRRSAQGCANTEEGHASEVESCREGILRSRVTTFPCPNTRPTASWPVPPSDRPRRSIHG